MQTFIITYYTFGDATVTVEIKAESMGAALEILKADEERYMFAQLKGWSVK